MKKKFLAGLVLIPLLAACGNNTNNNDNSIVNPGLPEGGTTIDLSKDEDVATLTAKIDAAIAANAIASLTTGGKATLNLNKIDLSVAEKTPELTSAETVVNVQNLTGSLEAGVAGLNGTYADLTAFAKVNNLSGNISAMGYNVPLANINLAAYLKSGTIYADASDPAIKATVQGVAAALYAQEGAEGETPTQEEINEFVSFVTTTIESIVGPNWKVAVPGLFGEEMLDEKVVPNLPTASYFEGCGAFLVEAIAEIGFTNYVTFKIYDDGSFGAELKLEKQDFVALIPEEEMGGADIKEASFNCSILFNKDLHLKNVTLATKAEIDVDEGDGYSMSIKEDINVSLDVELGINIASYIPSDLQSYTVYDLFGTETPSEN